MRRTLETLSLSTARRIALAAQGFTTKRLANPDVSALQGIMRRISLLQIDSVNVLVRSHYLPLWSRLGGYNSELLEKAAYQKPRHLFEYWAHEACLIPVELHPFLRWKMADAHNGAWRKMRQLVAEKPELLKLVRELLSNHGPATAGELEQLIHDKPLRSAGSWWDWRETKIALEWLLWSGEVSTAQRHNFQRVYDFTEQVIEPEILAKPTPEPVQAHRQLIQYAAQALGVATEPDLRDYFRLSAAQARPAILDLVATGDLLPVKVEGWQTDAYLVANTPMPHEVSVATLLSPFDSLVWFRPRIERLWNFHYRLEIYTPAPKRLYGYYVLPFLFNERLVARVDLKADRMAKALLVRAAYAEPGCCTTEVRDALMYCLHELATWLGLSSIVVSPVGDLASLLPST